MQIFIYCQTALRVSGICHTHHQEYTKLMLQPLVQIILSGEQASSNVVIFEEAFSPDSMICTRGCNYSFMCS